MKIILDHFPIPPSENSSYATIKSNRTGKNIRIKSKSLNEFKKAVEEWTWERIVLVKKIQRILEENIRGNEYNLVRIDGLIGFKKEKLFTKYGTRKRIDSSNRIKATHDALSEILGIDDRYFFSGIFKPCLINEGEKECITIILTMTTMSVIAKALSGLEATLRLGS